MAEKPINGDHLELACRYDSGNVRESVGSTRGSGGSGFKADDVSLKHIGWLKPQEKELQPVNL